MHTPFTSSDYARLPEGCPAQRIEGFLIKDEAPTYGHQRIQSRLHAALVRLVHPDLARMSPVDVVLGEHDVYQPDLVVLRNAPSLTQRDREVKTNHLLAAGVQEVWLVDPDAGVVERHTTAEVRQARGGVSLGSEALPGLTVLPDDLLR